MRTWKLVLMLVVLLASSTHADDRISVWFGGHEDNMHTQLGYMVRDDVEIGCIYHQSFDNIEPRAYEVGVYAYYHLPVDPNSGLQIPVPWGGGDTIAAQAFAGPEIVPDWGGRGGIDTSWALGVRFAEVMYIKYNPDVGIGQETVSAGINYRF